MVTRNSCSRFGLGMGYPWARGATAMRCQYVFKAHVSDWLDVGYMLARSHACSGAYGQFAIVTPTDYACDGIADCCE